MNAIVTRYSPGNLAIGYDVWTLPIEAARYAARQIHERGELDLGSYWHENLARPLRKAVMNGRQAVVVRTAGFSTGELANMLPKGTNVETVIVD